jgi:hypothetical protein
VEPLSARLVSWVIALALGVLFGVMGTAVSQSRVTVFDAALPVGLVIGLLAVTLLLMGLRLLYRTRTAAMIAAFGLVLAVFLLSQPSAGGSVLLPANSVLALAWTFGPTVIALLVIAWPRFSRN